MSIKTNESEVTLSTYEGHEAYRDDPVSPERVAEVRDVLLEVVKATKADGSSKVELKKRVGNAFYPLTLNFDSEDPESKPIKFRLVSEGPARANPWEFMAAGAAGVNPQIRRIHELLYEESAPDLPMRWQDYSYVYDYRPLGGAHNETATNGQQDFLLSLLAESETTDGRQVIELVPRIGEILPADVPDGGILATP